MLIKIFGAVDVIASLVLILLVKGVIFVFGLSIISVLDIISRIIIVRGSVALPNVVVIIVSLFLLQNGVFSLLG